jgi:ornithine cyclodeaminase
VRLVELGEIERSLEGLDLLPLLERAFVAYSEGQAVVPPVGELILDAGEVHVKHGFLRGEPFYVVKIASGFYGNPARGLPSGDGLMLLFSQATGAPVALLLDHGRLTDLRTAVAGAIAARYLAPERVERIGVAGSGVQARLQLRYLRPVTDCRSVLLFGRDPRRLDACRRDVERDGFDVQVTHDPATLGSSCNLIVTATPATRPLLQASEIRPGTHVTAIGSDTPEKQELDPGILGRAHLVVADSRAQCRTRGEIARALAAGAITPERVVELGEVIAGRAPRRTGADQITVFDSTGVAVQDVAIATAVARALGLGPSDHPTGGPED